jgi:RNA polymerase sigma-70 factor (ECF subfamily)
VNLAIAGDQLAMVAIVERYQRRIFGLCYRMLGHRQDAEDMAQEAFGRALLSLTRWDQGREFEPWLLTIAANRCRTLLARRKRRVLLEGLDQHPEDTRSAADSNARQLAEEVELALQGVRPEYREAFLLFHRHELGYAQIAAAMGCPLGTAKTWVHRARRELIRLLLKRDVFRGSRYAVRSV